MGQGVVAVYCGFAELGECCKAFDGVGFECGDFGGLADAVGDFSAAGCLGCVERQVDGVWVHLIKHFSAELGAFGRGGAGEAMDDFYAKFGIRFGVVVV